MQYTRIYADPDGESHFDEVAVALVANDLALPAPPLNVSAPIPANQFVFIMLPPGWYGGWHPSPRRQYWVHIAGQLDVEVSDGEVRRFNPGDVGLLDDMTGRGHVTRVIGGDEVRGMVVQLPL